MKLFDRRRWSYFVQGALWRLSQSKRCPCCGEVETSAIDRKLFHALEECHRCRILFRFPNDTITELTQFYEQEYSEPGITTELPSPSELKALIESKFKRSQKDFSDIIAVLCAIGLKQGDAVLDYGASWGYGTWQFAAAGFKAQGYEVSTTRAQFGANIGVNILTKKADIMGPFDGVYSGHVLEYVGDPLAALREQIEWTKPGGM